MDDIAKIRQELQQIRQELTTDEPIPEERALRPVTRRRPCLDFGLFLLSYLFFLIVIVTAETAVGFAIHPFTALVAIPCAWLVIAWLRKAPLYALLVTAAGAVVLFAAAYGMPLLYDTAKDSASLYKPATGMLMNGWSPFRLSFTEFANTHTILPYNDGWPAAGLDGLPKAAFMIGAAFYALTGTIESGKLYNLIAMLACVFTVAPLLRDAFKLHRSAAVLAVLLAAVNPVTLSQIGLYYTDGLVFQMLTIAAASFAYSLYKKSGTLATTAKLAALMAVAIAFNTSPLGAVLAVALAVLFMFARLLQIILSPGDAGRARPLLQTLLYLAAMAVCAVLVLGASTYVVNFMRYGSPLYGMLDGGTLSGLAVGQTGTAVSDLPLIGQFFGSMFSPVSNDFFTQVALKIPFTLSREEWTRPVMDANVSGWGMLFGGIFLLSVLVLIVSAIRQLRRNPRGFWLVVCLLAVVIFPAAVIPGLFSARHYLLPFWLPMAALVSLFAPEEPNAHKPIWMTVLHYILAPLLCVLLIVNAYTGLNYLRTQRAQTAADQAKIEEIQTRTGQDGELFHVTTIARGQFYGLLFNLQDADIAYQFSESLPMIQDELLYNLVYAFSDSAEGIDQQTDTFLNALYSNGYAIAVTARAGSPMPPEMAARLQAIGLMQDGPADPATGYLALIDPDGTVRTEQTGFVRYTDEIGETDLVFAVTEDALSAEIGGKEYGSSEPGFHIVVYDTENAIPVASVRIDADASPVMTEYPVRIPEGNE